MALSVSIKRAAMGKDAHDALVTHGLDLEDAFRSPPSAIDTSRFIHVGAARYKALLETPAPEWMVEGFMRPTVTTVMGGAPFTGKTWLGLQIATSIAAGIDVWPGAETKPTDGIVVWLSYDGHMSVEEIARRAAHLDRGAHRRGQDVKPSAWADRFVTIGNSETSGPWPSSRYTFSEGGVDALCDKILYPIQQERGPIAAVFVDTLSSSLPEGCDENSSSEMNGFMNRATGIAFQFKAALAMLHHPTKGATSSQKRGEANHDDWTSYFRGSSAVPAAAGAVAGMYQPTSDPALRCLTCWGNSARRQRYWFEVTDDPDRAKDGMIDYWLPSDAPQSAGGEDTGGLLEGLAQAFPESGELLSQRAFVTAFCGNYNGSTRQRVVKLTKGPLSEWVTREEDGKQRFSLTYEGEQAVAPFREGKE